MTSRQDEVKAAKKKADETVERIKRYTKEVHTKHEEIMNCIESTNDIVSKILEILEPLYDPNKRPSAWKKRE